jgi:lauroyl/myristoyl acyltransferase
MKECFPDKKETSAIMRQSMASLIGLMTCYHLDTTRKDEEIVYGNVFEEIGYGFVGLRSKKFCPYRILMEVDPK